MGWYHPREGLRWPPQLRMGWYHPREGLRWPPQLRMGWYHPREGLRWPPLAAEGPNGLRTFCGQDTRSGGQCQSGAVGRDTEIPRRARTVGTAEERRARTTVRRLRLLPVPRWRPQKEDEFPSSVTFTINKEEGQASAACRGGDVTPWLPRSNGEARSRRAAARGQRLITLK
ncbi:hypothetical protein NDU88_000162 [Pleurodeles waltl]|uniref:Uncharacterized protein n=1 Tax=Pleurodeles waltl TaxID=8319 RepID=A0AAV7Q3B2_PLEWA|nr:hypothetical protein NDU88_000162 [Pleurodeles waltl]